MQIPTILIAACGLSLLAASPVIAEDFTIGLSIYPGPSTTTLFVSSSNVRYRARYSFLESQDWIFNVADERLVVIDHQQKKYYETSAQDRTEVLRLAHEYDGGKIGSALPDEKPLVEIKPCERDNAVIEFLRAPPPRLAPTSADAIPRIEHCELHTISVKVGSAGASNWNRIMAEWLVTADIQAPEFFKFLDAVLEEGYDPLWRWRMRGWWIEAFDEIRSKGLFPLGVHYYGDPSTPTYGAHDLLSNRISWASFWIRKGPIDPAVFTILKEGNSVLSPVLPASYNKIDSPVVRGIASLKAKIESDGQLGDRRLDVGKGQ